MKTDTKQIIGATLSIAFSGLAVGYAQEKERAAQVFRGIKTLMSQEEFARSGLSKLSDGEMMVLDAWLQKHTREAGPSSAAPTKAQEVPMEQVTGIGGVFFKAKDPKGMIAWYRTNLGIQSNGGYADFNWRDKDHPEEMGHTTWRIFPVNTKYFGESSSSLMINYRVANLDRMLEQLRKNGVKIEKIENHDYGRWAWIMDPEENRIELWEPRGE